MAQYKDFIPENIAPVGVRRIGIYNRKGNRVGYVPLESLAMPVGAKQYSFGALSDVHVQYDTAQADFQKALSYLNSTEDVEFTCICGDLTVNGTDAELTTYKGYVDSYSADTPVYAVFGNHDTYQGLYSNTQKYTGQPFNYTFTQGNDVFIMVGNISGYSGAIGTLFTKETLQWLYETLEANRNKRCFLFQHILYSKGSGDALNVYPHTKLSGAEATVFESLISHYKNVVWFHGHSHFKFYLQYASDIANIDKYFGTWSIHIPSLAVPRDVSGSSYSTIYADSEGYVVDVYENGIHLRGRDFVRNEFLPIASYWLDTPLRTVEANSYSDSTGTLQTVYTGQQIDIPWKEGYTCGGSSGTSISVNAEYITTDKITLESGYQYTLSINQDDQKFSLFVYYYTSDGAALGRNEVESFQADGNHSGKSVVLSPKSGAVTFRLQSYCMGNYSLVKNNVTVTKSYVEQ